MKRLLQVHAMSFALLFIVSTMPVFGQTATTGVILGTVSDPNGGVIPDTTVDLINPATNESKTVKTKFRREAERRERRSTSTLRLAKVIECRL